MSCNVPESRRVGARRSPIRPWAGALLLALAAGPAGARIYQFDNATSGGLPDCDDGALNRTFTVGAAFNVSSVAVGLNVSHGSRGQVRVQLVAPGGETELLMSGNSGDSDNDYDILMSINTEGDLDDDDTDPIADPIYNRLVEVDDLADFNGVAAAGTWTLQICDNQGGASGTFNSARLVLIDGTTVVNTCTSRITIDWATFPDEFNFSNTTVGGVTMTETSTVDIGNTGSVGNSAPTFRVDQAQQGNQTGFYRLWMDAATLGGTQQYEAIGQIATFGFSIAVSDLEFAILDNDFATGDFEDMFRVEATLAGAFSPYQRTNGIAMQPAGDLVEGDTAAAANATTGNATYRFEGLIDQFRAIYLAGDLQDDPGDQIVGVSDIQFCAFDYGDAPNTFGTQLANGARHILGDRTLFLGANRPDGESNGQPVADSLLDDNTQVGGVDDEDGVAGFPLYVPPATTYSVNVTASNASGSAATLRGWIDWNRDGDFADANEISVATAVPNGTVNGVFAVTWNAVPNNAGGTSATYARFRISTSAAAVASPTGQAPDGEVEDYQIPANTLPVGLAWVDSSRRAGRIELRFATATETGNAGFRVWGVDRRGGRSLAARAAARGVDSFSPRAYAVAFVDRGFAALEIEDVPSHGSGHRYGPFPVGATHGVEPAGAAIDWAAHRAELEARGFAASGAPGGRGAAGAEAFAATPAPSAAARLLVREEGVQRVSHEALLAAGVDLTGVGAERIALTDAGRPIARHVSKAVFGPGAEIEFFFRPERTLASSYDVVTLTLDPRRALPVAPLAPAAAADEAIELERLEARPDRVYSPSSPNGDPWYDARLLSFGAPARVERQFDLPDLADGDVVLRLDAWGYSFFDGVAPDHHLVARLNGVEIVSDRFDGLVPWTRELEVSELVSEHDNRLEIEVPGDTGYALDLVPFEGFGVAFARRTVAVDGRFDGTPSSAGPFAVTGLADDGAEPVVAWQAEPWVAGGWRRAEIRPSGGAVPLPRGVETHLVERARRPAPEILAGAPAPLARVEADTAIVAHPAFADGLDELVARHGARGLAAQVATVDRIYAAYSDHAPSADAIRRFLAASAPSPTTPLRYVVLVGAESSDPWDHLGLGSISFVPTLYRPVVPEVPFSPSDEALVDFDADGMPEVAIGRLPARGLGDLEAMLAKLAAWESRAGEAGSDAALLAAGASGGGGELSAINAGYAERLGPWTIERVEVDALGLALARERLLDGLDAGTPLVSFVGHSSPGQWDFEPLFGWQDVATLANADRPSLVTQWGCWSSYAVEPGFRSTSDVLVSTPEVGAALAIGAATLTTESSHRLLGNLFFEEIAGGAGSVGDALLGAKRRLRAQGGAPDAILGVTLLGDPAAPLPASAPADLRPRR
jgi:subtilisin-like proprotein convertase family protein